ncbi:hypothetical protein SAMN05428952_11241 [Nitrosomonas sp. Nm132]|jgi:hypothetical protein|nr:hypothetical protein SAMN05428952_11241 [Nitrosomonas sp. Nm132]
MDEAKLQTVILDENTSNERTSGATSYILTDGVPNFIRIDSVLSR